MRRNRSGLPDYCSWNYDRHGKRRVHFRKLGFTTYLAGIPYSDDFNRQYWAALEGVKRKSENVGAELRTKPGSLNELCVAYYRSPSFLDLKASTKDGRRGIIETSGGFTATSRSPSFSVNTSSRLSQRNTRPRTPPTTCSKFSGYC